MTFVLEQTRDGVDLVVTGPWSTEARRALEDGRADGLILNYARGFQQSDLEFVTGLPLERLTVLDRSLRDLSAIYSLAPTLRSLNLQTDPREVIELDRLPRLIAVAARWEQLVGSIAFAPTLERLGILGFVDEDFTRLESLTALTSLRVGDRTKVRSLRGIESMPWLHDLSVNSKALEDIEAIGRVASPVLAWLDIEGARAVPSLDPLSTCVSLQRLNISDVGDIPSVGPLRALVGLEWVHAWGSTKVLDGDLTPVAELPALSDLRMTNWPNYVPTIKQIKASRGLN